MRSSRMPTIAVIIPTYNRKDLLHEALACVLSQSHPANEVIVVDNGDVPIVPGSCDPRVTVHRIAAGAGASMARNQGAQVAQAEYIALLDDDDLWEVDYLAKVSKFLQKHSSTSYLITRLDRLSELGVSPYRAITNTSSLLSQIWLTNPGVGGTNSIIRRSTFLSFKGFDPSLITSEDRSLVAEFLLGGEVVKAAPDIQAIARVHSGPRLTNPGVMAKGKEQFLQKHWNDMPPRSRFHNLAVIQWLRFRNDKNVLRPFRVAWWLAASRLSGSLQRLGGSR